MDYCSIFSLKSGLVRGVHVPINECCAPGLSAFGVVFACTQGGFHMHLLGFISPVGMPSCGMYALTMSVGQDQ